MSEGNPALPTNRSRPPAYLAGHRSAACTLEQLWADNGPSHATVPCSGPTGRLADGCKSFYRTVVPFTLLPAPGIDRELASTGYSAGVRLSTLGKLAVETAMHQ